MREAINVFAVCLAVAIIYGAAVTAVGVSSGGWAFLLWTVIGVIVGGGLGWVRRLG